MDLIQWQKDFRWSNEAMAKKLGVTPGTISNTRRKKPIPSLLLATAIVSFTGGKVTLEDLGVEEK
jgi:DNA-binding XRE family transcriptional regulator